ncbi:MAG TPA: ATP-binding protein [Dehalococcoidia bacterium]|nr:ATP-binding protein [Dehalococcoidia bacterium]
MRSFFTTKGAGQGTGLGLSLCYDIVTGNNSSIYCQRTLGQGTDFIIKLPAVATIKG